MPKRIDPDARRAQIVDAYLRIVARSGVAAATTRALAVEAGIAAGALWHSFASIDDVVRAAFERVYAQTGIRIAAATEGRRGLAALDAMIGEIIPHDEATRAEAVVVVSFWGLLPAHDEFRAYTRSVEQDWGRQVCRHLVEAVEDGALSAGTPTEPLTDALLSVFEVMQLREVQGSPVTSVERRTALLDQLLSPWRV